MLSPPSSARAYSSAGWRAVHSIKSGMTASAGLLAFAERGRQESRRFRALRRADTALPKPETLALQRPSSAQITGSIPRAHQLRSNLSCCAAGVHQRAIKLTSSAALGSEL